jgi:hypothetical protein
VTFGVDIGVDAMTLAGVDFGSAVAVDVAGSLLGPTLARLLAHLEISAMATAIRTNGRAWCVWKRRIVGNDTNHISDG